MRRGGKVIPMDEYMTSRTFSCCSAELAKVYKSHAAAQPFCAETKMEVLRRRALLKAELCIAAGKPVPESRVFRYPFRL